MTRPAKTLALAITALAALWPGVAHADFVWPAMMLEVRLFTWWAIGLGLVVEFAVLRLAFGLPTKRAAGADLAMNAVSCLLGILLIPLAGIAWEVFPGSVVMWALSAGTFNPVTWGATYALGIAVNTGLEGLVLKKGFKLPFRRREWWWLAWANAVSVGLAFASLFTHPLRM